MENCGLTMHKFNVLFVMTSTRQSQIQTQIFFFNTDGELVLVEMILQSGGRQLGETGIQWKLSVMRAEQQFLELTAG